MPMVLDRAVKEGLIRTNPAIGCKLPPLREKEMKILTKEEIQRFLIQAKVEGMFSMARPIGVEVSNFSVEDTNSTLYA